MYLSLAAFALLGLVQLSAAKNITTLPIPSSGTASFTHYDFPLGATGACGCQPTSTWFPTAAVSQVYYGSSSSYGPACGVCLNITLERAWGATPEFVVPESQRVGLVVKVTDECPSLKGYGWCNATSTKPNHGEYMHIDISSPSPSVPLSWFPSGNQTLYGYTDFGAFLGRFETVSCEYWAGWGNSSALGAQENVSGCCPANPVFNATEPTCSASSLKASPAGRPARPTCTFLACLLLASAWVVLG